MEPNTPPSGGRGARKQIPTTRLGYQRLGVPTDVQIPGSSSRQNLSSGQVWKDVENQHSTGGSPVENNQPQKKYNKASSRATSVTSVSLLLKQNDLDAKRKIAELDEELLYRQGELADAEAALKVAKSKLEVLQRRNVDGSRDDEVEKLEISIIELQSAYEVLLKQVHLLNKSVIQRKALIEDEKAINDEIISEDNEANLSDVNSEEKKERVQTWVDKLDANHSGDGDSSDTLANVNQQQTGNDTISQLVAALGQAFGQQNNERSVSKVVDKELPFFSGNPEDWLTFHSEFQRTTEKYKYEESENIVRLRKYLKGPAKDSINHLLANPSNVEKIMATLKARFGNPQFVLSAMITKAKAVKSPDLNKPETIVDFGTAVDALVTNIVAFNMEDYLNNIQLLTELVEKLPPALRRDWYQWISQSKMKENLAAFQQWLEGEVHTAIRSVKPKFEEERRSDRGKRPQGVHAAKEDEMCFCCKKQTHKIYYCDKFKALKLEDRWKLIRENKLCFRCLSTGHVSTACESNRICGIGKCTKSHHRLLHKSQLSSGRASPVADNDGTEDETRNAIATAGDGALPMMYVKITGPRGTRKVLALLDIGCTFTALENDLADELGLDGEKKPFNFSVFGNGKRKETDSRVVSLDIAGVQRNAKRFTLKNVKTVDQLGINGSPLNLEDLKRNHPHLRKAKAHSIPDEKPKMVIGYDNYRLYHSQYTVEGPNELGPTAYKSILGWYVCGDGLSSSCHFACANCEDTDKQLHSELKNFFSVENCGVKPLQPSRSKEDMRALELLERNTQLIDGKWETCLLWREDNPVLPESYSLAKKRLDIMERKMDKNPEFSSLVHQKFKDYLDKGYLVPADKFKDDLEPSSKKWYLPWFFAYHATKKPRLVYDAAAKSNGKCLNDFLLKGPDLLNPLPTVLMRFREDEVALTGDIKEMFHQVKLKKDDWPTQTILYREPGSDQVREYYMTVLFFGAASSPCSAIYAKNKNADRFKDKYPEAVAAIYRNFYMDDFLQSCRNEKEAIRLRKEVTDIHASGGFPVVKWNSNSKRVLESIPVELRAERDLQFAGKDDIQLDKTLGMWWSPTNDEFRFRINLSKIPAAVSKKERRPTKREVTSVTMSLFDPLGFLSPVKVKALMIIQKIWKTGIGWDDEISAVLDEQWNYWLEELQSVSEVTIRRWMMTTSSSELNVFVDAAEEAYSCSIYLRFKSGDKVEQSFVIEKARVAPIKGLTIPRMELEAALMGARLAAKVKETFEPSIKIDNTIYWSDSKTVLCWLRSESGRFKIYVQVRVGEIQELSNVNEWRWIPSLLNVADDATRFRNSTGFGTSCRWLNGVDFLLKSESQWPQENKKETELVNRDELEVREKALAGVIDMDVHPLPKIMRFSSCIRLIRATAAVILADRRFMKKTPTHITIADMDLAQRQWIVKSQQNSCLEEVDAIRRKEGVRKSSRFSSVPIDLTDDGVLAYSRSLKTGDAINTIVCFIALRGAPGHMWSDNGTNFVGANKELKLANAECNQECLRSSMTTKGIEWHMNPPAAPHMGGSWERLIGVAKKILLSLMKEQAPRESVPRTVWAQAFLKKRTSTVACGAWKKGIVVSTFPGKDGVVRVVREQPTVFAMWPPVVQIIPLGPSIVTGCHWEGEMSLRHHRVMWRMKQRRGMRGKSECKHAVSC